MPASVSNMGLFSAYRFLLFCMFFVFMVSFPYVPGAEAKAPFNDMDRGVVRVVVKINNDFGTGSGFVISDNNIVTNHHVIANSQLIVLVQSVNGFMRKTAAKVIWSSEDYDLAILRSSEVIGKPVQLAGGSSDKGSTVYAFGFPGVGDNVMGGDAGNFDATVTQGILSRTVDTTWHKGGKVLSVMQHTSPINPGNSGGPLFNECGQVIGVNTALAASRISGQGGVTVANGVFLASDVSVLIRALKELDIPYKTVAACRPGEPASRPQATVTADEGAAKAAPGPVPSGKSVSEKPRSSGAASPPPAAPAPLPAPVPQQAPVPPAETLPQPQPAAAPAVSGDSWMLWATGGALLLGVIAVLVTVLLMRRRPVDAAVAARSETWFLQPVERSPAKHHSMARIPLPVGLLSNGGMVIGRDGTTAAIHLPASNVSRSHARLSWRDGLYLQDLGSKNGTLLNGQPVGGPVPLGSGDVIEISGLLFRAVRE